MCGGAAPLDEALCVILAHHGYPADLGDPTAYARWWTAQEGSDPAAALRELAAAASAAFAAGFTPDGPDLPAAPGFWHAVAGHLMFADWLGSDQSAFRYSQHYDGERMPFARARRSSPSRDGLRQLIGSKAPPG
jgi:HD domain